MDEGDTVLLDGSGTDPYGGTLSYSWDLTGSPAHAQLSQATSEDASPARHRRRWRARPPDRHGRPRAQREEYSASYVVHNVAPTVNAGADTTGDEGSIVSRTVFVSDPGTRDTHTASVDWNDGTSTSIPSAEAPSFEIEHVYADNDVYTVEVCVTDDDDGEDCDAFSVTVANAAAGHLDHHPRRGPQLLRRRVHPACRWPHGCRDAGLAHRADRCGATERRVRRRVAR